MSSPCSRRTFVSSLLATGFGLAGGRSDPVRASSQPLRFGLTPVVLDDRIGFLAAWADWIERQLGRPVVFVQRSRYREILDLLLQGRLDLAWICGYPFVRNLSRLDLIAVPRFRGRPLYQSYFIVGADSEIQRLHDLEGRLFAWADPDSNSGYLYPRFRLTSDGRDPDRFFRRTFFTWGHPRSVEAVAEGLADGAAVDSYVWETLARGHPELTAQTRVLERSPDFGFPPIVAGPALSEPDRQAIRRVLLSQVQEAGGRALLNELNLDSFSIETPDLYDDIARMAGRITGGEGA
ncbi:PhnD/SsuA/transferrin family substrate-binding protein [Thiocapsa sp.]|uniref:substrate-binding domain-containing protein n=1 Tax=Thiocapsa sp. TaxID=2024551 RepID=UPI0025F24526|nr:PhnD/SsuA/transferrin family substrate-binding protein [Thiocapsa sp.]